MTNPKATLLVLLLLTKYFYVEDLYLSSLCNETPYQIRRTHGASFFETDIIVLPSIGTHLGAMN